MPVTIQSKAGAEESPFIKALEARGLDVPVEDIAPLYERHGESPEFVQAIVEAGIAPKCDACKAWADLIGVSWVDPLTSAVTAEAVEAIDIDVARKANVIGLYAIGGVLTFATSTPLDQALVRRIAYVTQYEVSPVFALPGDVRVAVGIHYASQEGLNEIIEEFERSQGNLIAKLAREDLASLRESQSLAKIIDALLLLAISENASDIHIEPSEERCRVRFRVDGSLREIFTYSKRIHPAIACRLKVMSHLDIAESRFPQDGRVSMKLGSSNADFRLSVIPTVFGAKIVLRVLASTGKKELISLDQMLISEDILQRFRQLTSSPSGIVFVTGPTGSGKTTTLYAALHEIRNPEVNISTIEDPVEIRMEGISQSQVNSLIDLRFNILLRSILRQDPDIILVGEIRDRETAQIASEAALTGHLVLSTLHTNNAVQAVVRLVEMGVPPYLVAPTILGVLAQRLTPRICDNCKQTWYPSREVLERYFVGVHDQEVPLYAGRGCSACRGTGYKGRVGFHELVVVSEKMRSLISGNAGVHELTEEARNYGYRSLRYDGLKKALLGLTTLDQIDKRTNVEWA